MPVYEYLAVDKTGKKNKGVLEVNSVEELETRLREKKLHLLKIKEKRRSQRKSLSSGYGRGRLTDDEIARIFTVTGYISNTALGLINSLEDTKRVTKSKKVLRVLDNLIVAIQRGSTFTEALRSQSKFFPKYIIETVSMGEKAGELPSTLLMIAKQLDRNKEIKSKIKNASIYPTFVFSFIILLTYVVITFVFPRIVDSIKEVLAGRDYPPYTKIVMGIVHKLEIVSPFFPYVIGVFVALLFFKSKIPFLRRAYDSFLLKVPYLNQIILYRELINMLQILIMGIQSGISFVKSLEMAEGSVQNAIIKEKISNVKMNV